MPYHASTDAPPLAATLCKKRCNTLHFSIAKYTVDVYIREYRLKPDNFFVGRVYKNGRYESTAITEIGYYNFLQRWTGLTGYNFRKSQVVAMHAAGADVSTIAQQTGHQSLETLIQHYLTVSEGTIDKYL